MQNDYDFWMKWNDRLRKARDDAGASDTDIARACKVSNPTVHGWMSGKTVNIEAHNLLAACRLLKVSPFWVMSDDNTGVGVSVLPASMEIPAMDAIRLIALYAQATKEGRNVILAAAETAEKSVSRN
jgi:transcriptional regulator with XRE-family HTH domain